jgi:outer membrane protein assembly factor BamE (lipoprotein component of BamABCDE complex)
MKKSLKLIIAIFLISFIFNNCKTETKKIDNKKIEIKNLYVKDKNIHIVYSNDKQKQITFNGSDDLPFFYKNKEQIIFIRTVKENGIHRKYERKKLMIVSINDLTERTITEKKPFKDGNDQSNEIFKIGNPTISIDKKSIYFTTEKWVTGNELVKVNIENGKWDELFATNQFEYISSGNHKGEFLIVRSEIRDKGRAGYYMLVNEKGVVKKEFENKTSANDFMETIKNAR